MHTSGVLLTAASLHACRSQDAEVAGSEGTVSAGADQFEFQAETNRLMDIIINSLYKSKEVRTALLLRLCGGCPACLPAAGSRD